MSAPEAVQLSSRYYLGKWISVVYLCRAHKMESLLCDSVETDWSD